MYHYLPLMLQLVFQFRMQGALFHSLYINIKSWDVPFLPFFLPSSLPSAFTEWLIICWVSHAKSFIYKTIVPVLKVIYEFRGKTNTYTTNHKAWCIVVLKYNCGQDRSQLVSVINNDENQLFFIKFFLYLDNWDNV